MNTLKNNTLTEKEKYISYDSKLATYENENNTLKEKYDIIVNENVCDIIVMREMCEYVLNNLNKIGREKVKVSKIYFDMLMDIKSNSKDVTYSVASLRIDGVISSAFGISREKSSNLFKEEKVLLNFVLSKNDSKNIKEGDLISVRGFGRIKVLEILGETKKGRIKISVRIF